MLTVTPRVAPKTKARAAVAVVTGVFSMDVRYDLKPSITLEW